MEAENPNDQKYWESVWARHLEAYLVAPPRAGIWLDSVMKKSLSVLECAGGSCRDARYLFGRGYKADGSDFDKKTIEYLGLKYDLPEFRMLCLDAFKLDLVDDAYDVLFHNGFWIYFKDTEIIDLLKEQVRVARKYAIILVQNVVNKKLVEQFRTLSANDDLYKVRFFDIPTLQGILEKSEISYRNVGYCKFGGIADSLFVLEKKLPASSALVRWVVPRLYRFQPWSRVERIAMIVELDKQ